MNPVIYPICKGRIHQVSGQRERWQITVLRKFGLLQGELFLLFQQLEFVESRIQSVGLHHLYLSRVYGSHLHLLLGRIIYHILEHGILLFEHGDGIIALHGEVLDIEIHSLQIYLQTHLVVIECLGDVSEFYQSLDVVIRQTDLFRCVLRHVIHLGGLHNQVFTRLLIRELVEFIGNLGDVDGGKNHLVIQRHLQLHSRRSIILQRLGYIIRFAVSRAVGNRNRRRKIVVELSHRIDLRIEFSLIFADSVLSLSYFVSAALERQVVIHRHLQTLAERKRLLCAKCMESSERET